MNGFVYAIGKRELLGGETEMRGDDSLDRLALGVAGEIAGGDVASASRTLGEQASVFSLKSRRKASRLPRGG